MENYGLSLSKVLSSDFILLDVRTHCEFVGHHPAEAFNIPYNELEQNKDLIQSWEKPVVTYSANGTRSKIACQKLKTMQVEAYDGQTIDEIENALKIIKS